MPLRASCWAVLVCHKPFFERASTALRQVATPAWTLALRSEPPALTALLETTWTWLNQSELNDGQHQNITLGDFGYPQVLLDIDGSPLV